MKMTRLLLSALFLGATATSAFAQGSISLNWDTCTGPINRAVAPGQTGVAMNASIIGHNQPHQAYQVFVLLSCGRFGAIRDAWRFDAAGCQGSSLIAINHLVPGVMSKACPSFQGALAGIQIKDYSFDALTGRARAVLANTYPAGNFTQVNPVQRYFLAQFLFDHSFSTTGPSDPGNTCGGLEFAVCAYLVRASWLSPAGVETPWAYGQEYLTANDPGNTLGCPNYHDPGPTPAHDATWGGIKAQYKR